MSSEIHQQSLDSSTITLRSPTSLVSVSQHLYVDEGYNSGIKHTLEPKLRANYCSNHDTEAHVSNSSAQYTTTNSNAENTLTATLHGDDEEEPYQPVQNSSDIFKTQHGTDEAQSSQLEPPQQGTIAGANLQPQNVDSSEPPSRANTPKPWNPERSNTWEEKTKYDKFCLTTKFNTHDDSIITHTDHDKNVTVWTTKKTLGKGTYGIVYLQEEKKTHEFRAVKKIQKSQGSCMARKSYLKELQAFDHLNKYEKNFVKFCGFYERENDPRLGDIYLVMEYIRFGDLSTYLKGDALPEELGRIFSRQLLQGLEIMHMENLNHCDLKPQNILVASNKPFRIKISDFGTSRIIESIGSKQQAYAVGTELYRAPELSIPDGRISTNDTFKVDIWSTGCIVYQVMTGELPNLNWKNHEFSIQKNIPLPEMKKKQASKEAISFVQNLLQIDTKIRLSANEALSHPWLNGTSPRNSEDSQDEDSWSSQTTCGPTAGNFGLGITSGDSNSGTKNFPQLYSRKKITASPETRSSPKLNSQTAEYEAAKHCVTACYAVTHGNTEALREMIDSEHNYFPTKRAQTCRLFHEAVSSDAKECLLLLVTNAKRKGISHYINQRDENGFSPLYCAIYKDNVDMVKILLDADYSTKADIRQTYREGEVSDVSLLHVAAKRQSHEIACILLNHARALVDGLDSNKMTPLHYAAANGNTAIVDELVKKGAALDVQDKLRYSPLMYAVRRGNLEMVELLCDHGAVVELPATGEGYTERPTAYSVAVKAFDHNPDHNKQYNDIIYYLLSKGLKKDAEGKSLPSPRTLTWKEEEQRHWRWSKLFSRLPHIPR